ncbi:sensory box sensor histidine kinase [Photobacterium aphoticum]|uniref:histidine kinase n=1 Tax=Photobacterium aphoticum TaxID=754436 RepID=A0A090R217_9GAMM|nr:sensory box sensor histidine kinase [Photobacterium aphoticum]
MNNLDSIMADLDSGKVDAIAAVTCTPERLKKLNCTQPYSEEKWVMLSAVTQEKNYVDNHSHIGAVSGRFGEVLLKQLYPNNPITLYNSNAALLRATLNHQVEMAVISLSSASQLLQGEYLGKLRVQISKLDSEGRPVGIAVSRNNTILHDILNKTMAATEPSKLADIKNAWHTVTLNSGVSISKLVFWGFAGFGLIALLTLTFLYWTQKLNNEIAQRKNAEQKLTYLTNNFDGILLQHRQRSLDPTDIELLFVSEKIIDLIGISADELRARPQRIIELLQQRNDNVWLFGEINHALKQGHWQTELQLQSVNDHDRWIEIRSQVIPVEQGWQWTSILIDISNMKKQQFELEHAREEAESATEAKSRFLAMMSHEIRTPISGILSLLELMAPHTRDHAEMSGIHKHLDQSAQNLLNIVNDVLDFSKIEAGKLTLSPAPCVMADMLHSLMQPHVIHAKQKGLCFKFWQDPQLAQQLWLDELRLKQVLNNLLNNATKLLSTALLACWWMSSPRRIITSSCALLSAIPA